MQFKSLEDFVIQQLELLNLERDAEIAESRKLQETFSAKQLQERGVCILNLVVHGMRSGLYGRTIITFGSKLVGKELPSSNMSSGNIFCPNLLLLPDFYFHLFVQETLLEYFRIQVLHN